MHLKHLAVLAITILLSSCSAYKGFVKKSIYDSSTLDQSFTGFYLYDPEGKKVMYNHNGNKYFTPASNTKLFTFYTGLKILGDSVPAYSMIQRGDSTIIWGSGDPSFLHPDLDNGSTFQYLSGKEKLFISLSNFQDEHFGPGWSWDDYNYAYSTERSAFPIYGNVVEVMGKQQNMSVTPEVFRKYILMTAPVDSGRNVLSRQIDSNQINFRPSRDTASFQRSIPFRTSTATLGHLLADTLKNEIEFIDLVKPHDAMIVYSVPVDSLYKPMLQASDNFLAEQILLMSAGLVSDTLNSVAGIDYMKRTFLADLPNEPMWVDGSGLSRYNLFTPQSVVALLDKIYKEVPQDRLFSLLPAGGVSGTIKNWYGAEKQPFVFAKTGTLRNNHCLSGYLLTKRGKVLIFSFMHNNYVVSSTAIKKEMEKILFHLHNNL